MKTALQQFKETLKSLEDIYFDSNAFGVIMQKQYTQMLEKLKEFEELEKKQLQDAFIDGQFSMSALEDDVLTVDDWFTKTYGDEELRK
jgi:hypothetical protein